MGLVARAPARAASRWPRRGDALRRAGASVPAEPGLDAGGILRAAADGRIACLVLLGADPLADFPDRDLAAAGPRRRRARSSPSTPSSTSRPGGPTWCWPPPAFAEKPGTTTNIEGRVSPLSQKVTPVGTAHADWIIAADLAARLGHDLGLGSVEEIWDELRAVSPRHAALSATELGRRPRRRRERLAGQHRLPRRRRHRARRR